MRTRLTIRGLAMGGLTMNEQRQMLMKYAIALGIGVVLWGLMHLGWYKPRAAQLHEQLANATERVQGYQNALDNRPRVMRELRDRVDRTLGGDVEQVDHRLRTRLNRIAEQVQLSSPVVTTGRPVSRQSPARLAFPASQREIRNEIDFVEVDGSISAEGTLEQIIALVDRIEAEPWIKRIHSLRLDPKDNGQRFGMTVRLTTLFLPGREGELPAAPAYDEQRLARFASLVQTNPFRLPPPPPAAAPTSTQQSQPAPPPQRPPQQWVITGVAYGPEGAEAWLRNARTGEHRRLVIGDAVDGAVLVGATGDEAEFEVAEQRTVLAVGQTLTARR